MAQASGDVAACSKLITTRKRRSGESRTATDSQLRNGICHRLPRRFFVFRLWQLQPGKWYKYWGSGGRHEGSRHRRTGLLGSHIVERLVAQGYQVRALARRTSDIGHLRSTGVEIVFVEMWSKLVRARQMPYLNRASLGHLKIEILLDVSKVRKELGWEPKVSLDEGVRLYVEWRRRQKKG